MRSTPRARSLALAATLALATTALTSPTATSSPWIRHGVRWHNSRAVEPHVVGLRYAAHDGFDRAVIDIDGRLPSYRTVPTTRCRYDASGTRVPIKGRTALRIVFAPATAHDADGSLYEGPALARPHLEALRALAFTGDFEGHVSFCFALETSGRYRVTRLTDPSRVVVDVRH